MQDYPTILVARDDGLDCRLVRSLQRKGFHVLEAEDWEHLVGVVRVHSRPIPCGQRIKRLASRTLASRRVGRDSERSCSWDLAVRLEKERGEDCLYPGGSVQNDDVRCIRLAPGVTKLLRTE